MAAGLFRLVLTGVGGLILMGYCTATCLAQPPGSSTQSSERVDVIAYETLFRDVAAFKKMSDDAAAANENKQYLETLVGSSIGLNAEKGLILESIALQCEREVALIQAQIAQTAKEFRDSRPTHSSSDTMGVLLPPSQLTDLQVEKNTAVLRYRDILHVALGEAEFQKAQESIRLIYANQLVNPGKGAPR